MPAGDFAPLFRMLDDYDSHRAVNRPANKKDMTQTAPSPSFQPRFDVRELKDSYRLDGEIPGATQNNIDIEFTDSNTLNIKGRVERDYNTITTTEESDRVHEVSTPTSRSSSPSKYHPPTVEDENEEGQSAVPVESPSKKFKTEESSIPKYKYWVSERAVGDFNRTFTFPSRVNQDAVSASLKNGVLSIDVPKLSATHKPKKIAIE